MRDFSTLLLYQNGEMELNFYRVEYSGSAHVLTNVTVTYFDFFFK